MATEGVGRIASGMSAAATPTSRSTIPSSPTRCWRSSTWRSRPGPRSSASGGFPACGRAAARRRVGPGPALRAAPRSRRRQPRLCRLARRRAHRARRRRSDPAQAALPTATSTRPSAAARIRRCRSPIATCLVLADEANFANCSHGLRHTWLFDVREPTNPVSFATMPVPSEADYCAKGGNFGPHNLWENRPGAFQSSRFVFATYHNAGVRVFDIENAFQPREAGFFVPPDPERMFDPRPNRPQGHPVRRLLCRCAGRDVPHRQQRRTLHPAVRGA